MKKNKNARLYKTGDLVRWLSSGEIEYIGRNDFQVKIRGFRIELGEIESTLNEYKGVKQAVVLARENKKTTNKYLVAYYTSSGGDKLNEEEIFSYLATKLPGYMIPSAIMHLDKLPLTLNGKLDRKALPDPVFGSNIDRYVAPRNKLESKLCHIFADVLGIEADKVGINDDFFRIGGDSIIAIKLISKLNAAGILCQITDIFTYNNIMLLSKNIEKYKGINLIKTLKGSVDYPKIFYIHPGNGGCEVYKDIANSLADNYLSIGIDNYNLFFSKKITSLEKLSLYYITLLEKNNYLDKNKEIMLFGWSLGGKIALEMAYLLEKLGYENLKIILVDTIFMDEKLEDLSMFVEDINILKLKIKDMLLSKKGINDDNYINTILDAIPAEK